MRELKDKKSALRKTLRQQRNALSPDQQTQAAVGLVEQLKTLSVFSQSNSIGLYIVNDGEIDPGKVLEYCLQHDKRCYVPIVSSTTSADAPNKKINSLRFAEVAADTRFQNNHFGIAEPVVAEDQLIDANELDLVLVPLVGFDQRGNRIGMGGGFYDTTFAFKKANLQEPPQLIGLAHEIQRLDSIDTEHWDIPISAVVTDQQIYHCENH